MPLRAIPMTAGFKMSFAPYLGMVASITIPNKNPTHINKSANDSAGTLIESPRVNIIIPMATAHNCQVILASMGGILPEFNGVVSFILSGSPANLLLVILRREQRIQFSGIAQFDFEKPAARVWLGVQQSEIVGEGFVQLHNFAADGRINVARGLHGFHHGAGFAGFHLAPNF